MMLLTVSVASLMAEEDTSNGCTTFSSRISVMVPWEHYITTFKRSTGKLLIDFKILKSRYYQAEVIMQEPPTNNELNLKHPKRKL